MKSTTQRTLKVTSNKSSKTFTIRMYYPDGSVTKYRTTPMSAYEFQSNLSNTDGDWEQFLKTDCYYEVK